MCTYILAITCVIMITVSSVFCFLLLDCDNGIAKLAFGVNVNFICGLTVLCITSYELLMLFDGDLGWISNFSSTRNG